MRRIAPVALLTIFLSLGVGWWTWTSYFHKDPVSKTNSQKPETWQTYTSYGGAFSLQYPSQWVPKFTRGVTKDDVQGVEFALKEEPDKPFVFVTLYVSNESAEESARPRENQNRHVVNDRKLTINDLSAHEITYAYTGAVNEETKEYIITNGKSAVTIKAFVEDIPPQIRGDLFKKQYEASVQSFRFHF